MRALEALAMAGLRRLDPETAHDLALRALAAGLGPRGGPHPGPRVLLAGLDLPNPVGIAAGFDKNAVALPALLAAGPGFVEVGAITPRPQPGNPRPRLFRLSADRAAINRFGFNNDGMVAVRPRLIAARGAGVVGVNLGANKDSPDRAADYAEVLAHLYDAADFFTINVSSPNTERLRDLQGRAALDRLLAQVLARRADLPGAPRPLFLKIAPDLDDAALADIAELTLAHGLDGLIATNTTLAREGLRDPQGREAGGLSGAPLRDRAQAVLARLYRLTQGAVPLIGVGGIASAADAYARIRAGATAVQLYTAMVYDGPRLPGRIAADLGALLARDGFASVAQAVGTKA